jgi:hypothetical protein
MVENMRRRATVSHSPYLRLGVLTSFVDQHSNFDVIIAFAQTPHKVGFSSLGELNIAIAESGSGSDGVMRQLSLWYLFGRFLPD